MWRWSLQEGRKKGDGSDMQWRPAACAPVSALSSRVLSLWVADIFVVLYCNFRSLAFLGLLGFLIKAAKKLIFSYPLKCSQEMVKLHRRWRKHLSGSLALLEGSWYLLA